MKRSRPIVRVTLTDVRRHWSSVIKLTKRADVLVCKRGTPIAVLLSIRRYKQLVRAHQTHLETGQQT